MKNQSLSPHLPGVYQDSSFSISTLDELDRSAKAAGNFNQSDNYSLVWLTAGTAIFCIDRHAGFIEENSILLIPPGQPCRLDPGAEARGYCISFSPAFINITDRDLESIYQNIQQIYELRNVVEIGQESVEDLASVTAVMLKEFRQNNLYRLEVLKRYLRIFLIYLSRHTGTLAQVQRCPRSEQIMDGFMSLLEKNFRKQKMVSHYADALSVTPNYLNEVVKKISGNSVGYHIRQRVALEAKRQAAYSNTSMKSIAYELGFYDMSHFSKFFKNTTGMNFSDYKNRDSLLQPVA